MQTKSKAEARAPRGSTIDPDLARRFATTVASVTVFLDEIRQFRAKSLGISGPQFALLMAVMDLEQGDGVSIRHVAKAVHVDPSFITTQSKLASGEERPGPATGRQPRRAGGEAVFVG